MNKRITCLVITAMLCTQNIPVFASTQPNAVNSKETVKGEEELNAFNNVSSTTDIVKLPNKTINNAMSNIITDKKLKDNHIDVVEHFTNYSKKWSNPTSKLDATLRVNLIKEYNSLSNEAKWRLFIVYGKDNPYYVLLNDGIDSYLNKFKFKGIYKDLIDTKNTKYNPSTCIDGSLSPETYKETIYPNTLLHTIMCQSLSSLTDRPLDSLNKSLISALDNGNHDDCTITIRYKNKATGDDISEPTTISNLKQGQFTVKPKDIDGFVPIENKKVLSLTNTEFNSSKEVIFYYNESIYSEIAPIIAQRYYANNDNNDFKYEVTVDYVDADTGVRLDTQQCDYIKKDDMLCCYPNLYSTNINTDKYMLIDTSVDVPIVRDNKSYNIRVFCRKIAGRIEVECRDENNKLIKGTTSTYEDLEFGQHTITAPKLNDYELVSQPSKVVTIDKYEMSHRVIFYYKSKIKDDDDDDNKDNNEIVKGSYRIKFLDKDTKKELKPSMYYTGLTLPFKNIFYCPVIFNYECLNKSLDVSLDKDNPNREYEVYYSSTESIKDDKKQDKDKDKEKEKDKDKNKDKDKDKEKNKDKDKETSKPNIDDTNKEDINKEFIGEIYIIYQDSDGNEIATPSTLEHLKLNQPLTINAKEIDGFKLISNPHIGVTLDENKTHTTVYFQYEKIEEANKEDPEQTTNTDSKPSTKPEQPTKPEPKPSKPESKPSKPEPKPSTKPSAPVKNDIKYKTYGSKCDSYLVEVKYVAVDRSGTSTAIAYPTLINNVSSSKIDIYPKPIKGYKPVKSIETVEHNPILPGESVTLVYVAEDEKVDTTPATKTPSRQTGLVDILIYYRDINGKQLADNKLVRNFNANKEKYYTATALKFKNYEIIGSYTRTVKIDPRVRTNEIAFIYREKSKEEIRNEEKQNTDNQPTNPNKPNQGDNKPSNPSTRPSNPSTNPSNSSTKPNGKPINNKTNSKPSTTPTNNTSNNASNRPSNGSNNSNRPNVPNRPSNSHNSNNNDISHNTNSNNGDTNYNNNDYNNNDYNPDYTPNYNPDYSIDDTYYDDTNNTNNIYPNYSNTDTTNNTSTSSKKYNKNDLTSNEKLINTTPMRDISKQTTDSRVQHKPPVTFKDESSKDKKQVTKPKTKTFIETLKKRTVPKINNKSQAYSEYVHCNTSGGNKLNPDESKIDLNKEKAENEIPNQQLDSTQPTDITQSTDIPKDDFTTPTKDSQKEPKSDKTPSFINDLLEGNLIEVGGIILILLVGLITYLKKRKNK